MRDYALRMGGNESYMALPLFQGLATAIGTPRRILLKPDWREFPIIWAVIVASSGQRKTPGFSAALRPLHDMQQKLVERHNAEMVEYKQKQTEHKRAVAEHKQKGGEPPVEPERPKLKRLIVSDITIEAVAMQLEDNPRGVGVARDEMSGWLNSFNQYKSGKGSDAAGWLELHHGGVLMVDRKTAERRTIYVPRAAASITGTIQPGVMKRCYGKEGFENGMAARTIFAMPPSRQRAWTDASVAPEVADQMSKIYAGFAGVSFDREAKPLSSPLTIESQRVFSNS